MYYKVLSTVFSDFTFIIIYVRDMFPWQRKKLTFKDINGLYKLLSK